MKFIKKLTFLSVLLCTLVSIVALNLNVKATPGSTISGYTQITSISEIESGKSYLIAAVANGTTYVMNSDAASATKPASTVSSDITDFSSYEFIITSTTEGYSIQNSSSYYLGYGTSGTNVAHNSTYTGTTNDWTIEVGTKGSFRIASVKTPTRGLVFRASTYLVFGAYATSNVKADGTEYFDIELYKEIDATGDESGGNTGSGSEDTTGTTVSKDLTTGYENGEEVTTVSIDENVTVTFDKGNGSSTPKWYSTGSAVRVYAQNTMTVSVNSSKITITGVEFTFGSDDSSNSITPDVGTFTSPSWSGETKEVVFTIGGTKGNRRIAGISVTYTVSSEETPKLTAPLNVSVNASGVLSFDTTDSEASYVDRYDAVVSYASITYTVEDVQSGDTLYYNIKGESSVTVQAISNDTMTYSDSDVSTFTWNITADYPVVTIAEFVAADVHEYYYYQITGDITSFTNTKYGNLYLKDSTDSVFVYGVLPEFGSDGGEFDTNEKTKDLLKGMTLTVYGARGASDNGVARMVDSVYVTHTVDYTKVFEYMDTLTSLYLNYSYTETGGVTVEESDVTDFTKNETHTGTIQVSLSPVDLTSDMGLEPSVYSAILEKNDSTSLYFNTTQIRLYPGSTNGSSLTITRNDGVEISKIVVTYASTTYAAQATVTDDAASTITASTSGAVYTYEFTNGTSSVKIQNTANATSGNQVRINGIELFYEITGTERNYTFADGDAKLRFGAQISAEIYEALVAQGATFGVAIIPTTTLGSGTLTVDTEGVFVRENMTPAAVDANGEVVDAASAVYYQFALVIQNINVANFGTEFTAVSYVCVDGTYYYMNAKTYSVKTIAQAYVDSGDASYAAHLDALNALANLE